MPTTNSQEQVKRVSRFREVMPQVSAAIYWMNDPTFLEEFFLWLYHAAVFTLRLHM
jgi:hypothetical protein